MLSLILLKVVLHLKWILHHCICISIHHWHALWESHWEHLRLHEHLLLELSICLSELLLHLTLWLVKAHHSWHHGHSSHRRHLCCWISLSFISVSLSFLLVNHHLCLHHLLGSEDLCHLWVSELVKLRKLLNISSVGKLPYILLNCEIWGVGNLLPLFFQILHLQQKIPALLKMT